MIQLNLMPDVKLQYIRARQRKRMIMSIAVVASGFFIVVFLVLFGYVRVAQTGHLANLNDDIARKTNDLKSKQDLNKILTIQSQLESLPGLHEKKVISSRLFEYLTKLTPTEATISEVEIDFAESKLTIKGNTDEISVVNKFADTLKFTGFISNETDESLRSQCQLGSFDQDNTGQQITPTTTCRAFNEVVLSELDLGSTSQGSTDSKDPISYDLTFKFDPKIFANLTTDQNQPAISLSVPQIISTRSITEKPEDSGNANPQNFDNNPSDLFSPQPELDPQEGAL